MPGGHEIGKVRKVYNTIIPSALSSELLKQKQLILSALQLDLTDLTSSQLPLEAIAPVAIHALTYMVCQICRPTQALDPFRISALSDFDPFKPSTHSVFRPIQYLDLFRILTSRDFGQLGPTTHLESRQIQNFYLEEYEVL
ncbi:hypothetical protein M514_14538 [Trichuris suis]|uniref:Uncharacterized protein n=1 Tax=Trichuris suis TaxID=68888 RepID=A0A085NUQ2_9BILA|nr:hypothetical protein M514_14538 [Trichuris suis]